MYVNNEENIDMSYWGTKIALVVSVLLLSGCASVPTASDLLTKIDDKQGAVVMMAGGGRLAMARLNWTGIEVKSEKTEEKFSIRNVAPVGFALDPKPPVFIGQLPPGSYKIDRLAGTFTGVLTDWMLNNVSSQSVEENLGSFRVNAGQITDLGTLLVYTPIEEANISLAKGASLMRWSQSFGQPPGWNKLRPVPGFWF